MKFKIMLWTIIYICLSFISPLFFTEGSNYWPTVLLTGGLFGIFFMLVLIVYVPSFNE
jgi:hypothetical protein